MYVAGALIFVATEAVVLKTRPEESGDLLFDMERIKELGCQICAQFMYIEHASTEKFDSPVAQRAQRPP
jgi:hypothetical protein